MLGLCCCIEAFPILVSGGYSLLQCTGFSLRWLLWLQSMGSSHMGFSSCDSQAQLLYGMWDPPGPGIKLVSPALAGRFLTTGRGTREVLLSILFVPLSCCPSPSTSYSRLPTPQGFLTQPSKDSSDSWFLLCSHMCHQNSLPCPKGPDILKDFSGARGKKLRQDAGGLFY